VLRPLAVWLGLVSARASRLQHPLMAWFGIRGIGSLYYLAYAIQHGLPSDTAQLLTTLTVSTIAVSIVVHGVSVTPLMKVYGKRAQAAKAERIHIRTSQAMRCVSSPFFHGVKFAQKLSQYEVWIVEGCAARLFARPSQS
jgi:NhaP-type Na+/H+ or K+/H+ antiporter